MGFWLMVAIYAAMVFGMGRWLMELGSGSAIEVRVAMGLEFLAILALTSAAVIVFVWSLPGRA